MNLRQNKAVISIKMRSGTHTTYEFTLENMEMARITRDTVKEIRGKGRIIEDFHYIHKIARYYGITDIEKIFKVVKVSGRGRDPLTFIIMKPEMCTQKIEVIKGDIFGWLNN